MATTNTFSQPRAFITIPYNTTTHHHSIELHSNRYHRFVPDQLGQNSKITIEVEFSGSDAAKGTCHFYYVKADGTTLTGTYDRIGLSIYMNSFSGTYYDSLMLLMVKNFNIGTQKVGLQTWRIPGRCRS